MFVFVSFALGEIAAAINFMDIRLVVLVSIFILLPVKKKYGWIVMILSVLFAVSGYFLYLDYECEVEKWDNQEENHVIIMEGCVRSIKCGDKTTRIIIGETVVIADNDILKMDISYGDYVKIKGNNKHFEKPRNPGNFDEKSYYTSMGCTKKLLAKSIEADPGDKWGLDYAIMKMRKKYLGVISKLWDNKNAGIISAMTVGERENLDEDIQEDFRIAGISHILAISGVHLSIIGMGVFSILRKRFRYVVSGCGGICTVLIFGIITCGGASVRRAIIMFILNMAAQIFGRSYDMITGAALAALLLMIDCPYVIYNTGFILSFGAIAGICGIKYLKAGKILSVCIIQLSSLPLVMYLFYEFPLYGALVNILVLPLVGVLLISGFASGITGMFWISGGRLISVIGLFVIKIYDVIIRIVKQLPYNNIVTGKPELTSVIICVTLFYLVIIISGKYKKRWINLCIFVPVIWLIFQCTDRETYISAIDVGQGDCIVINNGKNGTYMIDAGSSDVGNVYKYRIKSCLKACGIDKLNGLLITHMDNDHINAAVSMMKDGIVDKLYLPDIGERNDDYLSLVRYAEYRRIPVVYMSAGHTIISGDMKLVCKYPYAGQVDEDANEMSLVIRIEYGDFTMLCMGDLGEQGEKHIINDMDKVSVLKVGHHGSRNSTCSEFLERVSPAYAIISSGVRNRYGHPHSELLWRLDKYSIKYDNTAECGYISVRCRKDGSFRVNFTLHYRQKTL